MNTNKNSSFPKYQIGDFVQTKRNGPLEIVGVITRTEKGKIKIFYEYLNKNGYLYEFVETDVLFKLIPAKDEREI